jgi:CO/xanthine dehydrogenase FAD-binding subunit
MKPFDYYEPRRLNEACSLLYKFDGQAKVLAGGTDLLVELKNGAIDVVGVINIKKIKGLDKITFRREEGLRIGALVTWSQLLESKSLNNHFPLMMKAAETMASIQIRNVATLAGNICHASPAANGAIPLLLYEAECIVKGVQGKRTVPIEQIFEGPQKNSLKKDEILTEIFIPLPPSQIRGNYFKFSLRRAMDLALVAVGALVNIEKGIFREVRIALGAVAPTPFRARNTESFLKDKAVDDRVIREAAEVVANECDPITDIRGSKEYRIELVKELAYRVIKEAAV